jgi:hypothetical protein
MRLVEEVERTKGKARERHQHSRPATTNRTPLADLAAFAAVG